MAIRALPFLYNEYDKTLKKLTPIIIFNISNNLIELRQNTPVQQNYPPALIYRLVIANAGGRQ